MKKVRTSSVLRGNDDWDSTGREEQNSRIKGDTSPFQRVKTGGEEALR